MWLTSNRAGRGSVRRHVRRTGRCTRPACPSPPNGDHFWLPEAAVASVERRLLERCFGGPVPCGGARVSRAGNGYYAGFRAVKNRQRDSPVRRCSSWSYTLFLGTRGRPRRRSGSMKNIILCSDGTGNQRHQGTRHPTSFKLFEAVDLNEHLANPDPRRPARLL